MNPFGATLVLLLTARDARRFAAESALPRALGTDRCPVDCREAGRCVDAVPHQDCIRRWAGVTERHRI